MKTTSTIFKLAFTSEEANTLKLIAQSQPTKTRSDYFIKKLAVTAISQWNEQAAAKAEAEKAKLSSDEKRARIAMLLEEATALEAEIGGEAVG